MQRDLARMGEGGRRMIKRHEIITTLITLPSAHTYTHAHTETKSNVTGLGSFPKSLEI